MSRRKKMIVIASALILILLTAGSAAATGLDRLTVTVTTRRIYPVEGASVAIYSGAGLVENARTDGDGVALIEAISGTYQLVVAAEGYRTDRRDIEMSGDTAISVDLERPDGEGVLEWLDRYKFAILIAVIVALSAALVVTRGMKAE